MEMSVEQRKGETFTGLRGCPGVSGVPGGPQDQRWFTRPSLLTYLPTLQKRTISGYGRLPLPESKH